MRITILILAAILISFPIICSGQLEPDKIEKYLRTSKYAIDSEASAIVLFERTDVEVSNDRNDIYGRYSAVTYVHKAIRILKKEAIDAANIKVFFPRDNYYNNVRNITGTTYNLEGNVVKKTPLPEDDQYKTKLAKNIYELSFTMPEVKEGSIIEYAYQVTSPLSYVVADWQIQEEFPKLMSEFVISMPQLLGFTDIRRVRDSLTVFKTQQEAVDAPSAFNMYKIATFYGKALDNYFWVRKNIPATKKEPYVLNLNNQKESMQLLLKDNKFFGRTQYTSSWKKYNDLLWRTDSSLGLRKHYSFMTDTIKAIANGDTNKLAIARAIFSYLRKSYKNDGEVSYDTKNADYIRAIFFSRNAAPGQLNLLLISMLNNAGLEAYMLKTSTTSGPSAIAEYPMPNLLYYTACALVIDDHYILLDAGNKNNSFGMLPLYCYNGYARVISKEGDEMTLHPDMLEDVNTSIVDVKKMNDSVQVIKIIQKMGIVSSYNLRRAIAKDKEEKKKYFEKFIAKIGDEAELIDTVLQNLDMPEDNLIVKVTLHVKQEQLVGNYFFNTSYIKAIENNPFVAVSREYPVEFQSRAKNSIHINVALPDGFMIDSIPPAVHVQLSDSSMEFEKIVAYYPEMNTLSTNVVYKNKQTVYANDAYESLRKFYEQMIKEENKVVEVKRKKN